MTAPNQSDTKVTTGKVRLSYCHVWEPYAAKPDQVAKYSTVILIPKSDRETLKKIKRAQAAALELGKGKFGGKIPNQWKSTLHDCDEEDDLEKNPEYAGHFRMSVSSNTQPGIVDRRLDPILDKTEIYSGCYVRVSLNAFAFNTQGNKGVSFGLNHIQKMGEGDSLTGRSRAEDDFDKLDDEDDEDDDDDENVI